MGIVWLGPKKRVRPDRLLLLLLLLLAKEEGGVHGFAVRSPLSPKSSSFSPYLVSPLRSTDQSDDAVVKPPALDEAPPPSQLPLVKVAKTERFARLPVWPVWMGVVTFFVGRVLGPDWAAKLEDFAGGRVCPNFFDTSPGTTYDTSPFLMLVHHRHSFAAWDPIRWFQSRFILPEGFPAHPHRGFTTLTYFLRGGFRHRDSLGVAQSYGAANNGQEHHSQWLFTGAGLLHEEMFDGSPQQELYQIWINAPASHKLAPPSVQLLGDHECPTIVDPSTGAETVVLAGEFGETAAASTAPLHSPLTILHASVPPGSTWSYPSLPPTYETLVMYVRKGSCEIAGTEIPVHSTAYLDNPAAATTTPLLSVTASANDGVDFMLLAGEPLSEPVAAQGSMVMNHPSEINQAYADYQRGFMGRPWDHALSDEDWNQHLAEFPCSYRYNDENNDANEA